MAWTYMRTFLFRCYLLYWTYNMNGVLLLRPRLAIAQLRKRYYRWRKARNKIISYINIEISYILYLTINETTIPHDTPQPLLSPLLWNNSSYSLILSKTHTHTDVTYVLKGFVDYLKLVLTWSWSWVLFKRQPRSN